MIEPGRPAAEAKRMSKGKEIEDTPLGPNTPLRAYRNTPEIFVNPRPFPSRPLVLLLPQTIFRWRPQGEGSQGSAPENAPS